MPNWTSVKYNMVHLTIILPSTHVRYDLIITWKYFDRLDFASLRVRSKRVVPKDKIGRSYGTNLKVGGVEPNSTANYIKVDALWAETEQSLVEVDGPVLLRSGPSSADRGLCGPLRDLSVDLSRGPLRVQWKSVRK